MRNSWIFLGLLACEAKDADESGGGDADSDTDTDADTDTFTGTYAASCAGDQVGSFAGSLSGPITGELSENGVVDVRFDTSQGMVSSSGRILDDGSFNAGEQGLFVVGTYDLVACTGTGTWDDVNFDYQGTWEIAKVTE